MELVLGSRSQTVLRVGCRPGKRPRRPLVLSRFCRCQVASLFYDPSIGNPIHITIVHLVLLEDEEEDLKITHHADNTLKSFCKWQKSINMKGDAHPLYHDTTILLTRKDLCAAMDQSCETLGLSHVSGMCQMHHSCSINEDTGLPLAFMVAHKLRHSFGIQHDGSGNDCELVGKRPFIMSPQLLYDAAPLTWSRCSRQYITRFLEMGGQPESQSQPGPPGALAPGRARQKQDNTCPTNGGVFGEKENPIFPRSFHTFTFAT
ncbi:A disintegrin and metalloproteinase with thrombospondin motifs 7 [Saguinus oedipus]|uniref:A disintegrin and metalloproteinase with thrombospondin motifs 7 n=1 Tax=Saguinus oedipus TaxID=9490 RepID=A0ABQ9TT37_SAGOE|nr:A disintegrin and metalloproteinase with thrombospondin motifs 7 [Saguinus oedipus]